MDNVLGIWAGILSPEEENTNDYLKRMNNVASRIIQDTDRPQEADPRYYRMSQDERDAYIKRNMRKYISTF